MLRHFRKIDTKMGGETDVLQARIHDLEELNDNLTIEKDIAMTKMEQV